MMVNLSPREGGLCPFQIKSCRIEICSVGSMETVKGALNCTQGLNQSPGSDTQLL